ncbi:hypothetical protein ACQPZ8_29370 [Actinomadura nitritigenes]|uniref:hypothetical protein n=1 Tax=Actinomadura nitritigenes TaxID=134602 RepID=UPI003D9284BF
MKSKKAKLRPFYREGDTVEVVCQIRDGEPVVDPGEGRPDYAVPVWDELSNGIWIPDLYTSLPGKRGPSRPAAFPPAPGRRP